MKLERSSNPIVKILALLCTLISTETYSNSTASLNLIGKVRPTTALIISLRQNKPTQVQTNTSTNIATRLREPLRTYEIISKNNNQSGYQISISSKTPEIFGALEFDDQMVPSKSGEITLYESQHTSSPHNTKHVLNIFSTVQGTLTLSISSL